MNERKAFLCARELLKVPLPIIYKNSILWVRLQAPYND